MMQKWQNSYLYNNNPYNTYNSAQLRNFFM